MSRGDEPRRGDEESDDPQYEVGFGKPPKEHQSRKGKSGNPRGRPRKLVKLADSSDLGPLPANHYLLKEAYRPVTVRQGDERIQIPAIQAVFRAMGLDAVKGNRYAQRMLVELVTKVEAANREENFEYFKALAEYKIEVGQRFEEARRAGLPEPTLLPHPDDIIIDLTGGRAIVYGPRTEEEREQWNAVLKRRDMLQDMVSHCESLYRQARKKERKEQFLDAWMKIQRGYDEQNDNLPKRYR